MLSHSPLLQPAVNVLRSRPEMRKQAWVGATLFFLFAASLLGLRWWRVNYGPLAFQPAPQKNLTIAGGPDAAVERTRELIKEMRAVNWSVEKISFERLRLPDARLSSSAALRNPNATTYAFPNGVRGTTGDSVYDSVACYTGLYTTQNPTYYRGDRVTFNPKGFYIVGWKDGRVTKVPVQEVRWNKGGERKAALSFPGMPNYDASGPRLPYVEFADGVKDPDRERAYKAAVLDGDCVGCKE